MRKLMVFLDGTGNEIGNQETNLLKIYKNLNLSEKQKAHYVLGVGTNDSQRAVGGILQPLRSLLGLAFGLGLEDDVLEAYAFLCRNYHSKSENAKGLPEDLRDKAEADRIYIFGFSRGAYAARVLAGFIYCFGLVRPDNLHLIAPAFRAYRAIPPKPLRKSHHFDALNSFIDVLQPNEAIPIRALGLFDTVSSMVRLPRRLRSVWEHGSLLELGLHPCVNSNPSVRIVLHALAVDERRSMFRPQLWEPETEEFESEVRRPVYYGNRFKSESERRRQYVHQRWFPGFHSDIGGSQGEDRSGIGKLTLLWMLETLEHAEISANEEDNTIRAAHKLEPMPYAKSWAHRFSFKRGYVKRYLYGKGKGYRTAYDFNDGQPDALAATHDSIWGNRRLQGIWVWAILEFLPKSIKRRAKGTPRLFRRGVLRWYLPLFEPRHIPGNDEELYEMAHLVDPSVYERKKFFDHYDPPNVT